MKQLSDLLKGCTLVKDDAGNIVVQSIRNMQIVCLTTDDEFSHNRFANPMTVLGSNRSYGHLNLANRDNKPMIVPAQIAVLTKQAAQNHGMVKGAYISSKSSRDFNDAGCVQGSQTGTIRASESDQSIRFIPFGAREYIFEKVNNNGHLDNIYAAIEKVGAETGANSGKYLDQYFSKYDKELQEFIAHFERPAKTIGTIVLVDGEIVAIDKFPSFEYAEQVWDALIRDCYGAIAITQERRNKTAEKTFTDAFESTPKNAGESVVEHMKRALKAAKDRIANNVHEKLSELMDVDFSESKDSEEGGYKSHILKSDGDGYIGQVISEGGFNHLVSIVKKDSFNPERFRSANEMRKKASRQKKFGL